MSGDGWEVVKALPVDFRRIFTFSKLLPNAQWFWLSLERHCVAGCCGLGAFEFTHEAVRWACGDDLIEPEGYAWREEHPGDPTALAGDLREVASELKASMAPHADADIFCEPGTPASYAALLDQLADLARTTASDAICRLGHMVR